MKKFLGAALFALLLSSTAAHAVTNVCGTVTAAAAVSHQWVTSLGTNCTFAQSQPAVGDLANVASGTVLGNATGSSAAPTATATPVLGVASTTSGSLAFYNSGSANAVTVQAPGGATSAYNFNLPIAPGSSGQFLTSGGGGSTAMTWSTGLAARFTTATKTTNYTIASGGTDNATRFDNSGAGGSVTFTMPTTANLTAGDNWCFTVDAAQTLQVTANTSETINVGGVVSASAGNIQSSTVGSSICLYMLTTGKAYAYASAGPWAVN